LGGSAFPVSILALYGWLNRSGMAAQRPRAA
jgi:hypothetical protein